ncbi:MAG TPA: hypothetical protein VNI55_13965 [Gaiellaceae bacterium]|nr:hypothetical protein [Gaiellaceae bacterium]
MRVETDRERRARWFLCALDEKGEVHFPAGGWPGWTEEEFERRRADLDETIQDVSERVVLDVETREDGAVVVKPLAALN